MTTITLNDRPFWLIRASTEIRVFADAEGERPIGTLYPQQSRQEPRYYYRLHDSKGLTPVSGAKTESQAIAVMVGQWWFELQRGCGGVA